MSENDVLILQQKVKEKAAKTQSISSDFVQYKHLDFLANDIKTNGKLSYKTPDLVKWEYTSPFSYSILFKDEKLYINDDGNKSDIDIRSSKMFKQLNKLIIGSIKGDMFDPDEFKIEYFKNGKKSLVYFNCKNEKVSKFIKAFHIIFDDKADVIELKMIERSGGFTKIIFSNRELNKSIDNAVFTH